MRMLGFMFYYQAKPRFAQCTGTDLESGMVG